MKMVRSLLLGSAAGFVAVAGAQAADMPVKAKPVEYVKICTLYGAGFYYLPGTDICVKHGAYIRSQWYFNSGAAPTNGPFAGVSGQNSRLQGSPNDLVHRTRAIYTMDARTQTEYGTLRGYILIGYTHETPGTSPAGNAPTLYATRAFLQFAGFTLGKATSFYDIYSGAATSYFAIPASDTGDAGVMLAAYTFQFGNGFSATLAAEDPRRAIVHNVDIGTYTTVGAVPTGANANMRFPDLVANLRVDQAWGSVQIMGAVHDNSGSYFGAFGGGNPAFGGGCAFPPPPAVSLTGALACGHPDDEIGWAVGAGGIFKIPMPTGLTDIASFQVNYSEGATRYVVVTQSGAFGANYFSGGGLAGTVGSLGVAWWTDGIYGNPGGGYDGSIQNTKAWGVNASWDHLWTPNLKSSVYGFWINMEHNSTATALICVTTPAGTGLPGSLGSARLRNVSNCDPDFSWWGVGSRTQWNITPSFYVGFDVMYQRLETAFAGTGFYPALTGQPRPAGFYTIEDQDVVSVTARAHWDILP
jgi:Porin subfamily